MAGDWIKMRASLCTHPKVLRIAAIIGDSQEIGKRMSTGFNGRLDEIVTRDVTRDITLASLLRVWCAANEHTEAGVWENTTLETLDQVAGIPGFGQAMVDAEWAIYDAARRRVTFPNFLENNAPAKNGARSRAAERQQRYRERKAAERNGKHNGNGDVTSNVTSNAREEKRREDIPKSGKKASIPKDWVPKTATVETLSREFGLRVPEDVDRYVTAFRDACASKNYQYVDFDAAFRNCVRQDWPKLRATTGKRQVAM